MCSRCGCRLAPQYGGGYARYNCVREASDYGGKLCLSVAARAVDECVASLVLEALEPAALEVSLQVAEDIEAERRRLDETWSQRLERAQYEVERAMRQHNVASWRNNQQH